MPVIRFDIPGHSHYLTFSCFDRKPFLKHDIFCQLLAESVNLSQVKYNFDVWAYIFMPEHVHLLIFPKSEIYSVSDILRSIKQSSSRRITNWCAENDPEFLRHFDTGQTRIKRRFWMDGPGYDRNLFSREEIIEKINYIHSNPVRKGLVENPEDWLWSSAGFWLYGKESKVRINGDMIPPV
jgi:putative transposase